MSSVMSIGLGGMQSAAARFDAAASDVVRASTQQPDANEPREIDLPTAMITMSLASYDFKAATKVATVGRDMMQAALDMVA